MKPLYGGTSIYRRAKGLSKSFRYNEVSLYRVFSFSIQLLGQTNIVRYAGDFVISRFVISRFHCIKKSSV